MIFKNIWKTFDDNWLYDAKYNLTSTCYYWIKVTQMLFFSLTMIFNHFININPIQSVLWNYVKECGGAIMARIGFRHPVAVKRQSKAQKCFVFNFFDLQLSIATLNNSFWTIVLVILAAEGSRQKLKNFKHK